jgi:hypothetical protein
MASTKVTFTLDDATIDRLERAAETLAKPKSQVVREAILDYSERMGRLSEPERVRLLTAFDALFPKIPVRDIRDVERELEEIRRARRSGGRRHPVG